jgi:RNA-directed DNA polymerase
VENKPALPVEILRPSPARRLNESHRPQGDRQAVAEPDWKVPASERDDRRRPARHNRRHAGTDAQRWSGGPLSPLLANILLDDLDKELERRGLPFVRYADDFVIFTKSKRSAQRVFASVSRYLTQHLHLVVNQDKSQVVGSVGVEFLGFVFTGRRATINVTRKNVSKFKRRVKELTGRSWGVSMDRRLSELRSYLRGWAGYFGLAAQLKLFDKLDQWIRRRIRMCYWKRWRHPRTRRRELMRLGVSRRQAIRHAKSRKAYWRMARTIASGVGMTNKWLQEQGLISLKSLWAQLAPLR